MIKNCEQHIIESKKHIVESKRQGSIIEEYMIHFLLISIYREYELYIKKTIRDIIEERSDDEIANYVYSLIEYGSILTYPKLRGILSEFNIKYGKIFDDSISQIRRESLNSIRYNRNLVAHGNPVYITFGDVVNWHHESRKIINTFFNILNTKL